LLRLNNQITFAADMKKMFVLSMIISFAMICSCQKQDSAAEQQIAQRKAELDTREQALDERLNALDEKVKALAEKEKAMTNARPTASDAQSQNVIPDPAQVNAESDERIQQLPADAPALIADPSQVNSVEGEKDRLRLERLAQSQRDPEEIQRQRQRRLEQKWRMSHAAVSPAAEATFPTLSPAVDATSLTPLPTPP
jgi:chromosome segregation ATPase